MTTATVEVRQSSVLATVLDWMVENDEGDTDDLVRRALEYVKARLLAHGPLWDEIGATTLRHQFNVGRIGAQRRGSLSGWESHATRDNQHAAASPSPTPSSTLLPNRSIGALHAAIEQRRTEDDDPLFQSYYHTDDGRRIKLGDMNRGDLYSAAEAYNKRAKSNAFVRDFLLKVAEGLEDDKQRVRERYKPANILHLRGKISPVA